jgi:hypothetical protein
MVTLMPLNMNSRVDQEMHDIHMFGGGPTRMAGSRNTYVTIECVLPEGEGGGFRDAMARLADMEVVLRPRVAKGPSLFPDLTAPKPEPASHTEDRPQTTEEHTW